MVMSELPFALGLSDTYDTWGSGHFIFITSLACLKQFPLTHET